jgi:hypothetical protein
MKTQTYPVTIFNRPYVLANLFSVAVAVVFCLLSAPSFSQAINIVSPVTNQAYKLPDPATMQSATEVQAGITLAETTGKTLNAEAKAIITTNQNAANKAQAMNSAYVTGLNNFNKNDVTPYKADLDNYTATGEKFNTSLAAYNKAAAANNAMAAKDRKAATVATLNKQKMQLDATGAKLTQWKTKLDAAKTKLDVTNAALQKQKQNSETATKATTDKAKASKTKLNGLLDQLTQCANYAAKCHALLISKFSAPNTPDTGYFTTPVYKSAIATLYSALKN